LPDVSENDSEESKWRIHEPRLAAKSEQTDEVVGEAPFIVENKAPDQSGHDRCHDHWKENQGTHQVSADKLSIEQKGDQNPQDELDTHAGSEVPKCPSSAIPKICRRENRLVVPEPDKGFGTREGQTPTAETEREGVNEGKNRHRQHDQEGRREIEQRLPV